MGREPELATRSEARDELGTVSVHPATQVTRQRVEVTLEIDHHLLSSRVGTQHGDSGAAQSGRPGGVPARELRRRTAQSDAFAEGHADVAHLQPAGGKHAVSGTQQQAPAEFDADIVEREPIADTAHGQRRGRGIGSCVRRGQRGS